MNDERWQRVDRLLLSALDLPEGERAAFLDAACAGDPALRREVESLILSGEEAGSFIERPAVASGADGADGAAALEPGHVLGNYRIIRLLGVGGMGEVYLATDTRTGREAALKLLPEHFTSDGQRVQRFRREAHAVLALNHPNVVTVYDIGQNDNLHFIVTEFIEGETLRSRLARAGRLEIGEALDVAAQVAAALAYAHERGVVHRDVKPENVMLRPDGYVKVLDFGIAKLTRRGGAAAAAGGEAPTKVLLSTSPGMVMGTAHYMSPEQARGLAVDERTDVWSLGVLLYEMVAGRQPFDGETAQDVISLIIQRDPAPLSAHVPDAPAELGRIVSKALDKKKDERYQTARDLLADLRRFRRHHERESEVSRSVSPESAAATPTGTGGARATEPGPSADGTDGAAAVHTTSSAEYIVTEIKKHKVGVLFAAALLAVVVAAAGIGLYKLTRDGAAVTPQGPAAEAAAPQIKITPFVVNGVVGPAAASPDGKYVAYVLTYEAGEESAVWLRHLPTGSDVQIIPRSKDYYGDLVFSPDGNYIYYKLYPNRQPPASFNKVPVVGGTPTRLMAEFLSEQGRFVTFSPDGRRMAHIRSEPGTGELKLVVSNEDGTGERVLVSRRGDTEWLEGLPAWSPDGKVIAFFQGSYAGGFHHSLLTVRLEDGAEQRVGAGRWYRGSSLLWLPDGSGLLVNAKESQSGPNQVWRVPYPEGPVVRLTNDLHSYSISGVTRDGSTLLARQSKEFTDIWTTPPSPSARLTQVTFTMAEGGWGLTWAPDGRIVFASTAGGERLSLWVMNADGGGRRQLTSGATDWGPNVSPDGRHVVFVSHRSGSAHIWRVDMEGRDPRQLTSHGSEDNRPRYTGDGKWITFQSFRTGKPTSWRMPAEGGEAVQLSDRTCVFPEPSPDGRFVACVDFEALPRAFKVLVFPIEGGEPARVIQMPPNSYVPIGWTPDARAITFAHRKDGAENVWKIPLEGGRPVQLTGFEPNPTAYIPYHAHSPDGRTIAVARSTSANELVLITNFK